MGGFLFYLIDTVLLVLCGILLWRMPESPSEAPTDSFVKSLAGGVGILSLIRGAWRLIGLVTAWSFLFSEDSPASESGALHFMMLSMIVAPIALLFAGFLTSQRTIQSRLESVSLRDTLGDLATAVWSYRRPIGIAAAVIGVAQAIPFFLLFR